MWLQGYPGVSDFNQYSCHICNAFHSMDPTSTQFPQRLLQSLRRPPNKQPKEVGMPCLMLGVGFYQPHGAGRCRPRGAESITSARPSCDPTRTDPCVTVRHPHVAAAIAPPLGMADLADPEDVEPLNVVLCGAHGAGKSTLLGLTPPGPGVSR